MDLSAIGRAVLIAREGRRLTAYRDSVGVWTIGIGHTSMAGPPKVTPGLRITAAECDAIFTRDVAKYVRPVREALSIIPQSVTRFAEDNDATSKISKQSCVGEAAQDCLATPLPQHAFDALVSLCFNIGPTAFLRSSVLRRLRAGDRAGAAEAILMWSRPREVIPRRQGEYDQFRTPYGTALPRARRGDAKPVARPSEAPAGGSARTPPPNPAPAAPSPPAAPLPDAAPPAPAGRLARLWAWLRGFS